MRVRHGRDDARHGRLFFGLYRWGGQLWFQAGAHSWRLDAADLRLSYRRLQGGPPASEFSVHEGGNLAFVCSYRHRLRSLWARSESTLDTLDCETSHFLAHVAGQSLPRGDSEVWQDGAATTRRQTAADVRHAVVEQLALLADHERQRDHQRRIQIADLPSELFRGWFDDAYQRQSPLFRQAFGPAERAQLRDFTALLRVAAAELGAEVAEVNTLEDLQSRPIWTAVAHKAAQILSGLPPAPAEADAQGSSAKQQKTP